MFALTVITAVGGFIVGALIVFRHVPPLAEAARASWARWAGFGLTGAAVGLAAMNIHGAPPVTRTTTP